MIKFETNLDVVGEISGTIDGMELVSNEPSYMESIIKNAHDIAADAFDEFAATYGLTGGISHMFEYGTAGVTPGPIKFKATDRDAQLWTHLLEGHGGEQQVSFTFRPAVAPNPQPTTAQTGVPSKYLTKLSKRKYVFYNRAAVTEMGTDVSIKSDRGNGFLFVPFYGKGSTGKYVNNRGYMMWNSKKFGPIKVTPGRYSTGSFTRVWVGWWGATGSELMSTEMVKSYELDFAEAMKAAEARAAVRPVKAPTPTSIATTNRKASAATYRATHRRAVWRDRIKRRNR